MMKINPAITLTNVATGDIPSETLQSLTATPSISRNRACRRHSAVSPCRAKVCYWHKADIDVDAERVRFWG